MTILEYLLSDSLIQVIGQTMLHSLWQGILIAGILVICWPFLKESTAANRYALFSLALLSLFGVVMATFAYLYGKAAGSALDMSGVSELGLLPLAGGQAFYEGSQAAGSGTFFSVLVLVWVVGISVMSIKLILEWVYLERLKIHSIPLDNSWQMQLDEIADQLGLQQGIQLLQSKWVSSPVTIGMFRPIVLMPIGLVNGLNTEQVACILAHELAHIRRHDFLVNILQSVVETILFFNPMVWWLSRHIRAERELCCDDIAVGVTGDKRQLAYTLAKLEEWRMEVPSLALGFNSNPNKAIGRIRRLIGQEGHTKVITKGWTSVVLLTALITLFAFRPVDNVTVTEEGVFSHGEDPMITFHEELRQAQELELSARAAEGLLEEQLADAESALLELQLERERRALLETVTKMDTIPPKDKEALKLKEQALLREMEELEVAMKNSPEHKEIEKLMKEYDVMHQKMEEQWHTKQLHIEKQALELEKEYISQLREKEKLLHASPEMKELEELHRAYEKKAKALEEEMRKKGDLKKDEALQKEFEMQMHDLHNAFQVKEQEVQRKVQSQMEELQKIHRQFQEEDVMKELKQIQEQQQKEFQKINNEMGQKADLRMAELQAKLQLNYQIKMEKLARELQLIQIELEKQRRYREE